MPSIPSRDALFDQAAATLGHSFDGELVIGGKYASCVRNGNEIYVSGQVPRVGNTVKVTGRVGAGTTLEQAQEGAKICAMRALALLRQAAGSLDNVKQVLRVTVYVQCAEDFTQLSEVGDGASEILQAVLGAAGVPTRTSVGVYQLPKNASVELDMIAALA
ncbi:MAG: RidA family protein [Burkholderiales bacterium]|nr:RidA family protein [Burkholderiales bacterium]